MLSSYRFDDPCGEVGLESMLLTTAVGHVLQVPVTYRAEPLEGADEALIGTTEHSVLGRRWVYDGCADLVFVQALASAILAGGKQAELQVVTGDGYELREPATVVKGSGAPGREVPQIDFVRAMDGTTMTVIDAGAIGLKVLRVLRPPPAATQTDEWDVLTGTWPGQLTPTSFAWARLRS